MTKETTTMDNDTDNAVCRRYSIHRVDPIVTKHLGSYDANVSWYMRHHGQPSAERVAEMVADRNSSAARHMTGRDSVWHKDYAEWWPVLVAACAELLDEVRFGNVED